MAGMSSLTRRELLRQKVQSRPAWVLGVFAAFLSYASAGCLSNEYVIPKEELARLAQVPPETRGQRVLVVQSLGDRRGDALEQPVQTDYADGEDQGLPDGDLAVNVGVAIAIDGSPHHRGHGVHAGPSGPGFHSGAAAAPTPPPRPAKTAPRGSSGGGSFSGGGGGGGGDDLAVVAIIVVAIAVLAAAGLAVTEGVRYDGAVQISPWQPLHLKIPGQGEQVVALGDLQPSQAAAAESATVMDDEGWGMNRVERRPLDRKGLAFKVDVGGLQSLCACYSVAGVGSHIQLGYFPHHRLGLLASLSLAGGTDDFGHTFQRHSVGAEVQWFPLNLWRLHLGGFGHVGSQYASDEEAGSRSGLAWGGGAILELALTTRLALMFRGDWTTAKVGRPAAGGESWNDSSMITGGLAIY